MGALPGIALLILGLLISVGLHEMGHLLPAKHFGVKVGRYFIGFGPTLWSTTKGGTEYGLKAIPLGGYVTLAGMLAPTRVGARQVNKRGELTMAEQARRDSAAELEPGEEGKAFWRLHPLKRIVVMFGGPFVNLMLAALLLGAVMCGPGITQLSNTIGAMNPCESCEQSISPAQTADLQVGDTITAWGDVPVSNWQELSAAIAGGGTGEVQVHLERGGKELTVAVHPVAVPRPASSVAQDSAGQSTDQDSAGQDSADQIPAGQQATVPYVGISPTITRVRQSITAVPGATAKFAKDTAALVARLPVSLWNTAADLVAGNERASDGVVGIVGVADIAGSITASDRAEYTFTDRAADLAYLLAGLNMSLFVFNMIPLLPLDGGHILGALIEAVRRGIGRVRGSASVVPFDTARLLPLSYAVFTAFIAMTLLLIVADLVNPVV